VRREQRLKMGSNIGHPTFNGDAVILDGVSL
jgi:hypothetical protein